MHRNLPSKDAQQIQGPLGVLPLAPVGADRRVSRSDRQPANFSHHVKWREEIKKDGQNVGFSGQRDRSCIARYLHVLRVVTVKDCKELLVTVAEELSRSLLKFAERDGRASYPQFTAAQGIPT